METFKISPEQRQKMCLRKGIAVPDVRAVMQSFSSGKIRKTKIGKFRICDQFFPSFKETELAKLENHCVFYAVEKKKAHFLSEAVRRIFIWSPYDSSIFAVSPEICEFVEAGEGWLVDILLEERKKGQVLFTKKAYGREHDCVCDKILLYRRYSVKKGKLVCELDYDEHYYHWTEQDDWVNDYYVIKISRQPMTFIRCEPDEISASDVSYPDRPA